MSLGSQPGRMLLQVNHRRAGCFRHARQPFSEKQLDGITTSRLLACDQDAQVIL
jgi:hypothetical protein